MDQAVIRDPLLLVSWSSWLRLGPDIPVQHRMALAAGAIGLGVVRVPLHECCRAVGAMDPSRLGFRKQEGRKGVVTGNSLALHRNRRGSSGGSLPFLCLWNGVAIRRHGWQSLMLRVDFDGGQVGS